MGKWLPGNNESKALSKTEIDELRQKFEAREPGYFEDTEWYKLVEQADQKPVAGLRKCPECHLESPEGLEECPTCAHIFEGKECIDADCLRVISRSSVMCPHCGANQVPHVEKPWTCDVCSSANSFESTTCSVCAHARGALNPVLREGLKAISHKDDSLLFTALSVQLASGESDRRLMSQLT